MDAAYANRVPGSAQLKNRSNRARAVFENDHGFPRTKRVHPTDGINPSSIGIYEKDPLWSILYKPQLDYLRISANTSMGLEI